MLLLLIAVTLVGEVLEDLVIGQNGRLGLGDLHCEWWIGFNLWRILEMRCENAAAG